jgi:hypothetical protein
MIFYGSSHVKSFDITAILSINHLSEGGQGAIQRYKIMAISEVYPKTIET